MSIEVTEVKSEIASLFPVRPLTADTMENRIALIESATRDILRAIGEDPDRDGLQDTPRRVAKAYLKDLMTGYTQKPEDFMTVFSNEGYDQMVIVKDIPFTSFCEHHMLPFQGIMHVGYIPNQKIVGLSKIPRLVEMYARRLQVQERLTAQVADAMVNYLNPLGVMVVADAVHSCMSIRGVESVGSSTTTSAVRGVFLDDAKNSKTEFLRLVGLGG